MRRIALFGVLVAIPVLLAAARGGLWGLVGENGHPAHPDEHARRVSRRIERYVTSFEFTGEGAEVGSIVPLPGVRPT